MSSAPILFLIFNRPDTTQRVFNSIREAKPLRLYIAADGPRKNKAGEDLLCQQTRNIVSHIDWNCEIRTLYREENLGCKIAVSSAINWFFENEEQGIILEDDCLPNQSFFYFCEQMLHHYKDDERVMHIGGTNFQFGIKRGPASYYFSRYNHIWGWASWRRAWQHYDISMKQWPVEIQSGFIESIFKTKREINYWKKVFNDVYNGVYNTWDYQWTYSIWKNKGLSILPEKNLISNIGFDESATHTNVSKDNILANMHTYEMNEIVYTDYCIADEEADRYSLNEIFYPSLLKRLIKKLF